MPDRGASSLYELLGVPADVSQPGLTRAYRRRARELHPDLAADADPGAFVAVVDAYRVLSDPARRAAYDTTLHEASRPARSPRTRVDVQIRRSGRPAPGGPGAGRGSPIVAGPTRVFPNDPTAPR